MSRTDILAAKQQPHRSENHYRNLNGLNFSSVKIFDEDPMRFYNEFILGNRRTDKKSTALIIGDLVDFYLLECHADENEFEQKFDSCYALFQGVKSSAQAFVLADELFTITERDTNSEGVISSGFEERFREAFDIVQGKEKYKGKTWEVGLVDFNKVAKDYFDTQCRNIGKTVVDMWQIQKAKDLVYQLRTDDYHSDFINQESDKDIQVLKKVVIEFKYMDWDCKSEIDFLHISHLDKKIYRRDLKTAFDNEGFEFSYLKHYYYLQNAFYHLAVKDFARKNGMSDYQITPMDFLVLDTSKNCRRPLLYTTTRKHVMDGLNGFTTKSGYYYRGVNELIEEISWANENQIWDINKNNYENRGVVHLKEF